MSPQTGHTGRSTALALGLWGETVQEAAGFAAQAEEAGFHSVWSHELHRTATIPLAAAACATKRIGLGAGIALAFTRSPLTMALTALDLDELSGGRFMLGLGTGVERLNERWHGVTFGRPLTHMREAVTAIRAFIASAHRGEPIRIEGEYYNLDVRGFRRPFPQPRKHIPIFLAAVGPRMVRMAGEIGDGWLGHELNTPEWLREVIMPGLTEGLRRSGRDRRDFSVVLSVCCAVSRSRREAIQQAATSVAFYATVRTYAAFFASAGFEESARRVGEAFRAGDLQAMTDSVSDEMVEAFTAAGTPDDVRKKLREYSRLVDVINLVPPHNFLSPQEIRENVGTILETFSGARL